MAKQRFKPSFREALRLAHGERCIYCGRHILFRETKIDHVLPETTLQDPTKTRELKQRFGLPDSFNLLGDENLAPSCEPCNGQKSDLLLQPGFIAIVLANVEKCLPKVRALFAERQAEIRLDKLLRLIARASEQHSFSIEALIRGIREVVGEDSSAALLSSAARKDEAYFASNHQIMLSRHTLAQKGLAMQRIYEGVYTALKHGDLCAKRLSGTSLYEIRAANNLRIIYAIQGKRIFIITAYERIHGG
jgi:hypothetical protein